jgi:hypothetical protein
MPFIKFLKIVLEPIQLVFPSTDQEIDFVISRPNPTAIKIVPFQVIPCPT